MRSGTLLAFTDTDETISPSLSLAQLQSMRIAPQMKFQYARMKAGEVQAVLDRAIINGLPFHMSMQFKGEPLHGVELMARDDAACLVLPNPGAWAHENEIARKAWHEAWAKQAFGHSLEIRPIMLDANALPIIPANPGPDHPRQAVFTWGSVTSYLDQKGGFAFLWIECGPETPMVTLPIT
jgi:hypothetical protein